MQILHVEGSRPTLAVVGVSHGEILARHEVRVHVLLPLWWMRVSRSQIWIWHFSPLPSASRSFMFSGQSDLNSRSSCCRSAQISSYALWYFLRWLACPSCRDSSRSCVAGPE